jgi:hypothetical protein
MTDLEIDKALALAIGHKVAYATVMGEGIQQVWVRVDPRDLWAIRVFDHRDWTVIGPIAEKYNMFPYRLRITEERGYWNVFTYKDNVADTPQRAIALAVIGALT